MLDRLATVIWWIGVMNLAGGVVAAVRSSSMKEGVSMFALFAVFALAIFAAVYVLAGTFLSPPVGPLSTRRK